MKRYMYVIAVDGGVYGMLGTPYPWMPKVLARKTARRMNQSESRRFGRMVARKVAAYDETGKRSGMTTKDATPHGVFDWFSYKEEEA